MMMLWICLGAVVVGLLVLAVGLLELRAKASRLSKALATAQQQTAPAISTVKSLSQVTPPSFNFAAPPKKLIGASSSTSTGGSPEH